MSSNAKQIEQYSRGMKQERNQSNGAYIKLWIFVVEHKAQSAKRKAQSAFPYFLANGMIGDYNNVRYPCSAKHGTRHTSVRPASVSITKE